MKRRIDEIIIHCSATPEGKHVSVFDIDRWHRDQGWKGIGYHYVIYLNGSVHVGRSEKDIGAHCLNHNRYSIGVCYIGGLDSDGVTPKDTRTEEQKAALIDLLTELKLKYPNATIHGHREFANKECPCFDAKYEYRNI